MKILTTAAFSVLLLRKRISPTKWFALFALAVGVGIVQIQAGSGSSASSSQIHHDHSSHPIKGFMAVAAACFTSGLAGVYFEMVLKGSQVDLWVRNVQLSLFSLLPALFPILLSTSNPFSLFANFGFWAWATVLVSVLGGLITAVVIKYADNILKGFATSLSIVLSFAASVGLFGFEVTPGFVVGAGTVLSATWLYNRPEGAGTVGMGISNDRDAKGSVGAAVAASAVQLPKLVKGVVTPSRKSSYPGSPVEPNSPLLGEFDSEKRSASPSVLAAALRLVSNEEKPLAGHNETLDAPPLLSRTGSSSSSVSVAGYPVQPGSGYYSSSHSRSPSPVPGFGSGSAGGQLGTPPRTGGANGSNAGRSSSSLAVPVVNARGLGVEREGESV
jgi:UDP-sugar transporter A1/2/3